MILIKILSFPIIIAAVIGVFTVIPFNIASIAYFVKSSEKSATPEKKARWKKTGWILLALPWVLIGGSVILYILVGTISYYLRF